MIIFMNFTLRRPTQKRANTCGLAKIKGHWPIVKCRQQKNNSGPARRPKFGPKHRPKTSLSHHLSILQKTSLKAGYFHSALYFCGPSQYLERVRKILQDFACLIASILRPCVVAMHGRKGQNGLARPLCLSFWPPRKGRELLHVAKLQ